ncbi:MAG: bifunctional homocysteine S-methyltransferase/methylenetetrahydrofolate reductase [Spirochaetes bacterium]|nr:bifunctional homocysteine S-methyltransferase/methylenetetrahydrofolate reductase [Spirochaetota bacterium]
MNERLLDALASRIVVADGALGTELYAKGIAPDVSYDALNLDNPGIIASIHASYIDAGAELIETNTFGANRNKLAHFGLSGKVYEINLAGAAIAKRCAGDSAWVAGSIGPIGRTDEELSDEEKASLFAEHASGLIDGGADAIILETFDSLSDLLIAISTISKKTSIPIIAQLLFTAGGRTACGIEPVIAFLKLRDAGAAVAGANCGTGPKGLLLVMEKAGLRTGGFLSAFPNAGFPERTGDRMLYVPKADYIASVARQLAASGVNIIGGCCGTTPNDIRAIAHALRGMSPVAHSPISLADAMAEERTRALAKYQISSGYLLTRLKEKKVISVELDPPKGLNYEPVIDGAKALKEAGADVISVAENPLAIVRMSNISLASLIQREADIETIVHITGRDRNAIGMQSMLMGLAVDGIKNILAVTGDPPAAHNTKGTGVFELRSYDLISLIAKMNAGMNWYGEDIKKRTAFSIGAAFNPNTPDIAVQIERMKKKIDAGTQYFQTQPVFSNERIDTILELTQGMKIPIMLGILPLVSSKNAEFLHNEFPGISIPDDIRERMRKAGENGIAEGSAIAFELIAHAYNHVAGIYIMPPFNKHAVAVELIRRIRDLPRS